MQFSSAGKTSGVEYHPGFGIASNGTEVGVRERDKGEWEWCVSGATVGERVWWILCGCDSLCSLSHVSALLLCAFIAHHASASCKVFLWALWKVKKGEKRKNYNMWVRSGLVFPWEVVGCGRLTDPWQWLLFTCHHRDCKTFPDTK